MPSSIISHQAPALLIKLKYPKKIDGTAICLSTIVPDFNLFFGAIFSYQVRSISHSLLGLIIWTLPFTILTTIIFAKYIGPWFARLANKSNPIAKIFNYFGVDTWSYLKNKRFDKRFFIVASYSAIIGGFTHLLLDLPSHESIELFAPFFILKSPDFLLIPITHHGTFTTPFGTIEATLTVYRLIWMLETLILILPTLYFLRYIKKENLMEDWNSNEEDVIKNDSLHHSKKDL